MSDAKKLELPVLEEAQISRLIELRDGGDVEPGALDESLGDLVVRNSEVFGEDDPRSALVGISGAGQRLLQELKR